MKQQSNVKPYIAGQQQFKSIHSSAATGKNISLTEQVKSFQRGYSPITGASMHRANVAGTNLLDCPDEKMIFLSYDALYALVAQNLDENSPSLKSWQSFLEQTAEKG